MLRFIIHRLTQVTLLPKILFMILLKNPIKSQNQDFFKTVART